MSEGPLSGSYPSRVGATDLLARVKSTPFARGLWRAKQFLLNSPTRLAREIADPVVVQERDRLVDSLSDVLRNTADPRALDTEITPSAVESIAMRALTLRQRAAALPAQGPAVWSPTADPELSIVLGSYNRLPVLRKTIESVRSQTVDRPIEILVIDGGSGDGSVEWLIAQPDVITLVQHNRAPKDQGGHRLKSWGWFMNIAFRAAHGRYVCMISDDCVLLPGTLQAGLDRVRAAEAEGIRLGGVAFYFRNWPVEKDYFVQHTIGGMLMVNHGIYSREALETVGYAEEQAFHFYKCDSDLSLKIWHAGFEIVDCPHALVEHLMLPEETLRLENNATMDRDRDVLHSRWAGVYCHPVFTSFFKAPFRKELRYDDPNKTAELFRELVS